MPSSGRTSASSPGPVRIQRHVVLGEQGAQEPREHGVGDAFVARPRADADDAGATCGELVQQPRLADARFADEQERPSCRPRAIEQCELALAADEARRPDQARRNDGAARRQRRAAALDRRQQLDRLGRRLRAELVLEALLETLEGGDRRGAVAAQVVQAHQPALGVLGERIALDQALRVDQAARDRSALLARGRCGGERGVALLAPLAALGAQPLGELGKVVEVEVAEQLGLRRRARRRGSPRASTTGRGRRPGARLIDEPLLTSAIPVSRRRRNRRWRRLVSACLLVADGQSIAAR